MFLSFAPFGQDDRKNSSFRIRWVLNIRWIISVVTLSFPVSSRHHDARLVVEVKRMLFVTIIFWLAVAACFYAYFGYPILLAACHPFVRRAASKSDEATHPTISIVLAAYNEVDSIRAKIENCLALDYPHDQVEILIGSDGSDDGTDEIVKRYANRNVKLFSYSPRRGKMSTVNRLVREATGEICVFSDITELFDQDVLMRLVPHYADESIGAVTGNHIYNSEKSGLGVGTSFYWRFQRFLQRVESRIFTVCACDGTIYSCRRQLFPFPLDETINDDVAVPLGIISAGHRVIFEGKAIARGDVLAESGRFFRQKIRGQAGKYQNFINNAKMFVPCPIRRWWIFISHLVMPVSVPWCMLVALITNGVLALFAHPIYMAIFVLQIAFYGLAAIGWFTERSRIQFSLFAIPFYFVAANLGSLAGFYAYVTGQQRPAWQKVE